VRVALFVVRNFLACHYALFGYRETLEELGHEVIEIGFPHNNANDQQAIDEMRPKMPSLEQLRSCDMVLSTYHEYVQPWLARFYGLDDWKQLMDSVPVLARFDESMDRGDLGLPIRVPLLKQWASHYSFPAAQDAEKYGGEWLPYGADARIFHPDREGQSYWHRPVLQGAGFLGKPFQVGFIGTVYQKRQNYLEKLIMHVGKNTTFYRGNVMVQDMLGMRERETTELLAENYRNIGIFFCLPPASNLLVEKIFDVMACDTMVMYPRLWKDGADKNLSLFQDDEHIVYYEEGFYANNGKQVQYYLQHPEEVERIARAGGELVRSQFSLRTMVERMLTLPEKKCSSQPSMASQSK
jgi:Glycosyl transferases group 1